MPQLGETSTQLVGVVEMCGQVRKMPRFREMMFGDCRSID